ncbi:MAG TPA: hypothetical protein PK643_13580 [Saprospiraceae bacterium]|nr:hypothetical protein [Saprospiraceae bacterium]
MPIHATELKPFEESSPARLYGRGVSQVFGIHAIDELGMGIKDIRIILHSY